MRKTYYSEFYPYANEEGVVGTTMPALTEARVAEIIGDIGVITDDSVLTADEKIRILIPLHDEVELEYENISAQAIAFGINIVQLQNARTAWIAYLNSLSPAWDDESQNTNIDRDIFRQKINDYLEHLYIIQANNNAEAARRADVDGGLTDGGNPINRDDVITSEGTSNDTAHVGGVPVTQVRNELNEALAKAREAVAAIDTVAPATPTGLAVNSQLIQDITGTQRIKLRASWVRAPEADASFYNVEFTESGGIPIVYTTGHPNAGETPYYEWWVSANKAYSIRVRAADKAGNRSAYTSLVSHTTVTDTTPPNAPTSVSASGLFSSIAIVCITPAEADLSSIEVYEATVNNFSSSIKVGEASARPNMSWSFIRSGLPSGQIKYYWLRARDTSGNQSTTTTVVSATPKGIDEADLSNGLTPPIRGDYGAPSPSSANAPNLPTTGNYTGRAAINTNAAEPGKLYRYTPTGWTKAIDGQDVQVGTLYGDRVVTGSLTTEKFAARSITVDKLSVTSTDNLIGNANFEADVVGQQPLGWARFTKTGADSIQVVDGDATSWPVARAVRIRRGTAGSSELTAVAADASIDSVDGWFRGAVLLQPGDELYFECWVYSNLAANIRIEAIGRRRDGVVNAFNPLALNAVTTTGGTSFLGVNQNGWQKVVGAFRYTGGIPTKFFLRFWNVGAGAGDDAYYGGILLRRRNNGLLQIDGTLKANHIEVGSLTGDRFQAATIQGVHVAAQTLTANNMKVVGSNLNPDPHFQDGSFWVPETGGWYFEGADPVITGFYGRRVTLAAGSFSGTGRKHVYGGVINGNLRGLVPLSWYRLRARFWNASNQAVSVAVQIFDVNDNYISGALGVTSFSGNGVVVVEGNPIQIPANAFWYRYVIYNDAPGTAFTGACSVGEIALTEASTGKLIVDGTIEANHVKVRSLTGDRFQFNTLTGDLIAAKTIQVRNLAIGNFDNIIPDGDFRDAQWWVRGGGSGATVSVRDIDTAWFMPRILEFAPNSSGDNYSEFFNVESGATYRVTFRVWRNTAGTNGFFAPYLHFPGYSWCSLKASGAAGSLVGGTPGYDTVASESYIGAADSGDQTFVFTVPSNVQRQIQFRFRQSSSNFGTLFQAKIVRVSDATLIGEGQITTGKLAVGAVTAEKILVGSLSAISANLGNVTAGTLNVGSGGITIKSGDSGARLVISNSLIQVYDANGTLRVRMGIW